MMNVYRPVHLYLTKVNIYSKEKYVVFMGWQYKELKATMEKVQNPQLELIYLYINM